MYKILTASADTYITNKTISTTVRAVDANMGLASSIDIFKLYDENKFSGHPKTYSDAGITLLNSVDNLNITSIPMELSRGLVKFDLSGLADDIQLEDGFEATLKMYDVYGGQTTPSNFSLLAVPSLFAFDEGAGRDVESFDDLDVCNFLTASYSNDVEILWGTHVEVGNNLCFNINSKADIKEDYILDAATIDLKVTQEFETGQEDLSVNVTPAITAMLAGSITNNGFRISFIQAEEQDNKTRFVKRFVSRHSNDKNKTPRLIIKYTDAITETANVDYTNYQATILNLQKEYNSTDKVRLHIFVEDRNYNSVTSDKLPLKNKGKLIGSSAVGIGVLGKLCYSLIDVNTGDIVIPFDNDATVVSYDADEMHMILNLAGLSKGSSYEIKFRLTETSGDLQYTIGENNIFKVV